MNLQKHGSVIFFMKSIHFAIVFCSQGDSNLVSFLCSAQPLTTGLIDMIHDSFNLQNKSKKEKG